MLSYSGRITTTLISLISYTFWIIYHSLEGGLSSLHFVLGAVTTIISWFVGSKYDHLKQTFDKDFLTGAYNRRFVYVIFPKLRSQMDRKQAHLAVTLIDVDDLKKVNDKHGHKQGDLMIQELVACVIKNMRDGDIIARWGGDEFVIVTPYTDLYYMNIVIERVKAELDKLALQIRVSTGTAVYPDDASELDQLLKIADERMYAQKLKKV